MGSFGSFEDPALDHTGAGDNGVPTLDDALRHAELLKVKFADLKDQKKELAPQLAEKTGSHLIMRVGNVVVLYRKKPDAQPED